MNKIATCEEVAAFLSSLAEVVLAATLAHVEEEFAEAYGRIEGSQLAVLALGKLGARDLTFASDLDLIFIYTSPSVEQLSDGKRQFTASVYFNRLCQRLLGMLTSLNAEGQLYEVDTRLRPLGSDGPLAASFDAYVQYFGESAWTFEHMALTRARPVAAPETLWKDLEGAIFSHLSQPRDAEQTRTDAARMRAKVEEAFGTKNPWNVKYARGGVMDIDFIAQYLQIIHASAQPDVLSANTRQALHRLHKAGILDAETEDMLSHAYAFFSHVLHLLRLCSDDGALREGNAPEGLKTLLAEQLGFEDFDALKTSLIKTQETVYNEYQRLIGEAE